MSAAPLDAGSYSAAYAVEWSADGSLLYVGQGTTSPYIRVYKTRDWSVVSGLPAMSTQIKALTVSPDGSMIAVGYYNSPWLHIRDASTLALIAAPTAGSRVHGLAWSRDGSKLAMAILGSPYLRVLNTADWSTVSGTPTLAGAGYGLAWGPNDDHLVVMHSATPLLRVLNTADWSTVSGTPSNPGGGGIGITAAYSPDGSRLALGFQGSTYLRILDSTTWEIVASPSGITGPVTEVAWSIDGSQLAVTFQSNAPYARIYNTTTWAALPSSPVLQIAGSGLACRYSPLLAEPDVYDMTHLDVGRQFALGWSGPDDLSGTVAQKVGADEEPLAARVSLLRARDSKLVARTRSDAVTGAYTFKGLDARRGRFIALSEYPADPADDAYMQPVAGLHLEGGA